MAPANACCSVLCLIICVIVAVIITMYLKASSSVSCAPPLRTFGSENLKPRGYVIHLPDRRDREENLRQLLFNAASAGVELTVVDAVDGRSCNAREVPPFMDYSRAPGSWRNHLRGGEQGCLASYLKVFKMCKESQNKTGCFFVEDDAIVPKQAFQDMSALLNTHGDKALLLHGRRAYPSGWSDNAAIAAEEKNAGEHIQGWRTIVVPNYSTAFFALTAAGATALLQWIQTLISKNLHQLPADDLLSFACGAHPTVYMAEASQRWEDVSPVLTGLAPTRPLANRMSSPSDTERYVSRRSASNGLCNILPTPSKDV